MWSSNCTPAGFAAAKNDRVQNREKLARISEEEREVKERIEVYRRLRTLNIIGEERRPPVQVSRWPGGSLCTSRKIDWSRGV